MRPPALAVWASASILDLEFGLLAFAGPLGHIQSGNLLGDVAEILFGDVAAVLLALLVVEGLDEVPQFGLLARGQGGGLLGVEGFRFAGGGLEVVVFDPQLPCLTQVSINGLRAPR